MEAQTSPNVFSPVEDAVSNLFSLVCSDVSYVLCVYMRSVLIGGFFFFNYYFFECLKCHTSVVWRVPFVLPADDEYGENEQFH